MEDISSKTQNTNSIILRSFFVTITMLSTVIAFTLMNYIGEADARTLIKDPDCNTIDAKSAGECKINAQFLDDCATNANANCNIAVDIDRGTFNPSGSNELKLNYLLKSGIACSATPSQSWTKANCLMNTVNNYNYNPTSPTTGTQTPSIIIRTDGQYDRLDVEAKYEGLQSITNTAGKDRFKATNDMKQQVDVRTNGAGSGVDLEGDGADGVQLKYNQLISGPDNSANTNVARQQFDVAARSGGNIEFLHDEYGFDLKQSIINTAGPAGSGPNTPNTQPPTTANQLTNLNQGKQTLTAKVFNDADVRYDTYGLSTLSQNIENIAGKGTVQNLAGNPATANSPTATDGMRVNLEASGYGANVDADNTLQTLSQNIVGFTGSTAAASTPTALNEINSMLFSALARQITPNDLAEISVTENEPQSQTVTQAIHNSGGTVDLRNTADARINLGFEAFSSSTTPTAGDDPVTGDLQYEDLSQTLDQIISGATANTGTDRQVFNVGTTLLTLLSHDGTSQFIVDGFDQYLSQTTDGCVNCGNQANVQAIFSVDDAATFTLEEGSVQGLTQYVSQNGVFTNNNVLATIGVVGDGTDARILYQQEILNNNNQLTGGSVGSGTSSFSATFNQDVHTHCSISGNGNYFAAGFPTTSPTPRTNACTTQ